MTELVAFAKEQAAKNHTPWVTTLPTEIQKQIGENSHLGASVINRWLVSEGYNSTLAKVRYALELRDHGTIQL